VTAKAKVGLAAGGAAVLVLSAVALIPSLGATRQPLAFNHNKHVEELGLPCTTCHLYAKTGIRATIPNIEVCRMCHAAPLTESEEEAHLVEHIQAEEAIPWRKIYRVPEHVFFSHRRHTAVAGVECETCHGDVGSLAAPFSQQMVKITMERCMGCHWEVEASNDCMSCHR